MFPKASSNAQRRRARLWRHCSIRFVTSTSDCFRLATPRPNPSLDAVLYPLSRAADLSVMWLVIWAGLTVSGNRRAKRGGLRGLASLALTSGLVNALVKPLFGRLRPEPGADSWLIRSARIPLSSAFPSGHSASAAAFATGAAMEAPLLGGPLGALVTAVGVSRVRTRIHYPFDVVAGAAIGFGIARATRRVWPSLPVGKVASAPIVAGHERRALPAGAGIEVVINSESGSGHGGVDDALRLDLEAASFAVRDPDGGLVEALENAAGSKALGIVGGDDSVNAAAE